MERSKFSKKTWNKSEVRKGLEKISEVRHEILCELTNLLNEYHHCKQTTLYWDTVAGDWLEHFLHHVYAAMLQSSRLEVSDDNFIITVVSDLEEYTWLSTNSGVFHDVLIESAARLLNGESVADWGFSKSSVEGVGGRSQKFKDKILRLISTPNPTLLMVSPYFKCSRIDLLLTLIKWRKWAALDALNYPIQWHASLDSEWRLRSSKKLPITEFEGLVCALLPLYLPVVLLEGFKVYRENAMSLSIVRPKILYSAQALYDHLLFKLLAAEWRNEGTYLYYHQHGGGYGIDRLHALEEYEIRVSDKYLTFGWEKKENPNVRPLCVPQLRQYKYVKRKLYLLMCVDYPELPYRLHHQPMPGSIDKLRRETIVFAEKFSKKDNFIVRPYFQDYSGEFILNLKNSAPNIKLDNGNARSSLRYAQSRIVIHNYLGTSFIETLSLNVPTVAFYNADIYDFQEDVKLYMQQLEMVGVLYRSAVEAADFIRSIENNLEDWWKLSAVQSARKDFVDHYGNFSTNWTLDWENEFKHYI